MTQTRVAVSLVAAFAKRDWLRPRTEAPETLALSEAGEGWFIRTQNIEAPFAAQHQLRREGRIEAFSDWLTAPQNPMFARVAANRIWQWHFGSGLHASLPVLHHQRPNGDAGVEIA